MSDSYKFGLQTQIIHGRKNEFVDMTFHPHTDPIFLTTAYIFDSAEQMLDVFLGKETRVDAYARFSNPNFRALEDRIAVLDCAEIAQSFNNGTTALLALKECLLKSFDNIVAHRQVYGGTYGQLINWENFKISTTFVDARDPDNVIKSLTPDTKMIFLETLGNPTLDVLDYEQINYLVKEVEKRKDILVVTDITFGTSFNQVPLMCGVDIVLHSGTKFLNGMGTHLLGGLSMRKEIYEKFWQRYDGWGSPSPFTAWDVTENIKSSFIGRMKRHNENGINMALWLEDHPQVLRVYYPGLESHPNHNVAKRLMRTPDGEPGYGGMVSFELKGGKSGVFKFLNQISKDKKRGNGVISLCVSLGNIYTLICAPAISTHCRVPREKRLEMGLKDTLMRLSMGNEDFNDVIHSLNRGFKAI